MNRPLHAQWSVPAIGTETSGAHTEPFGSEPHAWLPAGDARHARPEIRLAPELVVAQAAHRVFGSGHPDRVRSVLDYHGLNTRTADPLSLLASRHGVSVRTMTGRIQVLRAALADVQHLPRVIAEATRASTPHEDHLSRVRIATTLHLPVPPAPAKPAGQTVSPSHLAAGRAGVRLLATIGPLDLGTLFAAIGRCRRFRVRDPLSERDLVAALGSVGAVRGADLRWDCPAGAQAPARYRSIVQAATGLDLTRQQMIDVLIAAGYTPSSAGGRMSSSHPLFERVDHDRYRLIGSTAGAPNQHAKRAAVA